MAVVLSARAKLTAGALFLVLSLGAQACGSDIGEPPTDSPPHSDVERGGSESESSPSEGRTETEGTDEDGSPAESASAEEHEEPQQQVVAEQLEPFSLRTGLEFDGEQSVRRYGREGVIISDSEKIEMLPLFGTGPSWSMPWALYGDVQYPTVAANAEAGVITVSAGTPDDPELLLIDGATGRLTKRVDMVPSEGSYIVPSSAGDCYELSSAGAVESAIVKLEDCTPGEIAWWGTFAQGIQEPLTLVESHGWLFIGNDESGDFYDVLNDATGESVVPASLRNGGHPTVVLTESGFASIIFDQQTGLTHWDFFNFDGSVRWSLEPDFSTFLTVLNGELYLLYDEIETGFGKLDMETGEGDWSITIPAPSIYTYDVEPGDKVPSRSPSGGFITTVGDYLLVVITPTSHNPDTPMILYDPATGQEINRVTGLIHFMGHTELAVGTDQIFLIKHLPGDFESGLSALSIPSFKEQWSHVYDGYYTYLQNWPVYFKSEAPGALALLE